MYVKELLHTSGNCRRRLPLISVVEMSATGDASMDAGDAC